ncbi:MAG: hypothetical protein Q4E45_00025 [Eubacteriales bacterium]|nr:hypothetical protein [Eubacteriales bacterium]
MEIPILDWNGNGRVDPQDIALSLAIAEAEEEDAEEDDEPS